MKYSKDGALLAVAASSGEVYIHDAADHYSLKTTTSESAAALSPDQPPLLQSSPPPFSLFLSSPMVRYSLTTL